MAACRTFAAPEQGEPDWEKAAAECQAVLDLEPIHGEANEAIQHIQTERACSDKMKEARELATSGRVEEAVDAYAHIKPDCPTYFIKVLNEAKDTLDEVKRRTASECKTYVVGDKWEYALKRCEVYARLACQTMPADQLSPPAGKRFRPDGRLGKGDWRPKDPTYSSFLKARLKTKPKDPPWVCPEIPAFRPPPPPVDPSTALLVELQARYPDPDMGKALVWYFEGRFVDGPVLLEKMLGKMKKAEHHAAARALLLDLRNVSNLLDTGQGALMNDQLLRAEKPFRDALELDEKLILGTRASKLSPEERKVEMDRRPSFVRRTIYERMTGDSLNKGKILRERGDKRQACRLWKLGASFARTNLELLGHLTTYCTNESARILKSATRCDDYQRVLDFAVDGDGMKEKAEEAMIDHGCK
jgi:hypothetical protein